MSCCWVWVNANRAMGVEYELYTCIVVETWSGWTKTAAWKDYFSSVTSSVRLVFGHKTLIDWSKVSRCRCCLSSGTFSMAGCPKSYFPLYPSVAFYYYYDVLRFKQGFLFCFFLCEIAAQGKVYEHINKPWCLYAIRSFTYLLKRMGGK